MNPTTTTTKARRKTKAPAAPTPAPTPIPKPEWGLGRLAPDDALAAWGARAIYKRSVGFELVSDRQDMTGEKPWRSLLAEALNGGGLAKAREQVTAQRMDPRGERLYTLWADAGEGLTILGDCRGSCGYVYLVAYLRPQTGAEVSP